MFANGRFSLSLLQAAAASTSPRTAAENRWVRIMSRGSSEGDGDPGPEQVGRELVETGVAGGEVHRAAAVVLFDVLVRQVGVPARRQRDAGADREFVARTLRQQRRHELVRRGPGVIQVSTAELHLRVVLVLGAEAETVCVLVRRMERQVGCAGVRE